LLIKHPPPPFFFFSQQATAVKKDVATEEAVSHRIRITLTSRNVKNLEKGEFSNLFKYFISVAVRSSFTLTLLLSFSSLCLHPQTTDRAANYHLKKTEEGTVIF
jgi:hypothetical protein